MSERDALLLEYPMEDDDLVLSAPVTSYHTSPAHTGSGRRGSRKSVRENNGMTMTSLHATQSSTDEDMIDAGGPSYSGSATSK